MKIKNKIKFSCFNFPTKIFDFCALLVNEIHFIVDFYHGVHQPVWDLQVPEDFQNVHFLIHCLRMTDVPHVDQQILKNKESTESKPAD